MTDPTPSVHEASELEFVVEHLIQSTPERIFQAYTTPELVEQWWSHPGNTMHVEEMDVRPGGRWRFVQVDGEGGEMVMHGEYREIDRFNLLSYTFNIGEGTDEAFLSILELEAVEAGTRLRLTGRCRSREQFDQLRHGAEAGAKAAWERLSRFLGRS